MANPFEQEQKLFSICVPCHGDKWKHMETFFKAMNEQEYKKFEVIITFDGKNPRGEKELKKMIKKYPDMDVSYFVIEHAGVSAARNESAKHAKGDYLAFPSLDCWYYPGSLRIFASELEKKDVTRVWGLYDPVKDGEVKMPVGQAPIGSNGKVWYPSFKYSNFADCSFPLKKEIFVPFDVNCKSLNDWEHNIQMLKKDNFSGKGWKYIPEHFFACESPVKGGLSDDSHQNWIERKKYIQEKNGIKPGELCVTSLGAPTHAFNVAEMLDAEYLPMPSFKEHNYKGVYLLGFYTREGGGAQVTRTHMDVFERNKGKNIIHWIGTDILDLYWTCSFMKLKAIREWMEEKKVINLCECDYTQKELKEIGIDAKIVPIPPSKLFKPMPLPKKFTVAIYMPGSETYKPELIFEVIEGCPDIDFILFGNNATKGNKENNWKDIGYVDYEDLMPQVSCNLRITMHDGLPLTPLQFMTAGRSVVCNSPIKGAIKVREDYAEIVKGLRKAQKEAKSGNVAQYKKTSDYWTKQLSTDKYVKTIRGLL